MRIFSALDHLARPAAARARAQHDAERRDPRAGSASVRLTATDIGSSSPSVLRSSGTSAMPRPARIASRGLLRRARLPATMIVAARSSAPRRTAEEQLAVAVAGEAADAEDLAGCKRQRNPGERRARSAPAPRARAARSASAGGFG